MVNGVPVNDMESGWVYWSNWSGLADVTNKNATKGVWERLNLQFLQ